MLISLGMCPPWSVGACSDMIYSSAGRSVMQAVWTVSGCTLQPCALYGAGMPSARKPRDIDKQVGRLIESRRVALGMSRREVASCIYLTDESTKGMHMDGLLKRERGRAVWRVSELHDAATAIGHDLVIGVRSRDTGQTTYLSDLD